VIKKALTVLILISMTLHCANKLGLLSYLYANRSEIAVSLGLSSEYTIAVCDSDYFQGKTLIIAHEDGHSFPPLLIQTQEINLFFISVTDLISSDKVLLELTQLNRYQPQKYQSVLPSVFHPPAIA